MKRNLGALGAGFGARGLVLCHAKVSRASASALDRRGDISFIKKDQQ
jgi:hypothetical protein